MLEHGAHYIDGKWQPSNGRDTLAVVNAATEEVMGSTPASPSAGVAFGLSTAVARSERSLSASRSRAIRPAPTRVSSRTSAANYFSRCGVSIMLRLP